MMSEHPTIHSGHLYCLDAYGLCMVYVVTATGLY